MNVGDNEENTAVIVCEHVFNKERAVAYADYDDTGIQAVCDLDHTGSDIKIISLGQLFAMAPETQDLRTLPINHFAVRQNDGTWEFELISNG